MGGLITLAISCCLGFAAQETYAYIPPPNPPEPITPTKTEHRVDYAFNEDATEYVMYYNYIRYEFERDDVIIWARAYVDEIESVTIYGPHEKGNPHKDVHKPQMKADVVTYFQLRFDVIDEPGEEGFDIIWQRKRGDPL